MPTSSQLRGLRRKLLASLEQRILPDLEADPLRAGLAHFESTFLRLPYVIARVRPSLYVLYDGRWLRREEEDESAAATTTVLYVAIRGAFDASGVRIYTSPRIFFQRALPRCARRRLVGALRRLKSALRRRENCSQTVVKLPSSTAAAELLLGPVGNNKIFIRSLLGLSPSSRIPPLALSLSPLPIKMRRGRRRPQQRALARFYTGSHEEDANVIKRLDIKLGFRERQLPGGNGRDVETLFCFCISTTRSSRHRLHTARQQRTRQPLAPAAPLYNPAAAAGFAPHHDACCENGRHLRAYLEGRRGTFSRRPSTKVRLDGVNYYVRLGQLCVDALGPESTCGFYRDGTYAFGSEEEKGEASGGRDLSVLLLDARRARDKKVASLSNLIASLKSMDDACGPASSSWRTHLQSIEAYCETYVIFVAHRDDLVALMHLLLSARPASRNKAFRGTDATDPTCVHLSALKMTLVSLGHLFNHLPEPDEMSGRALVSALAAEYGVEATLRDVCQRFWREMLDVYGFDFLASTVRTRNALHFAAFLNQCNRQSPFEHSVCKLPPHVAFVLRRVQSGGFLTNPVRFCSAGDLHHPCDKGPAENEARDRARVLLGVDVASAYGSALVELPLPSGFIYHFHPALTATTPPASAAAATALLTANCDSNYHRFSEYRAHFAFLYLGAYPAWRRGEIKNVTLQSAYSLLPALRHGKRMLDLAISYVRKGRRCAHWVNFHDNFIHVCPVCPEPLRHPRRRTDRDRERARQDQREKDAAWNALARAHQRAMGKDARTVYQTIYVCHDFAGRRDPFDPTIVYASLRHLVATCQHPFMAHRRAYPNVKKSLVARDFIRRLETADPSDAWLRSVFAIVQGTMRRDARARASHNFSPLIAPRQTNAAKPDDRPALVSTLSATERPTFKTGLELNMLLRCGGFEIERVLHVFVCATSLYHARLARAILALRADLKGRGCPLRAGHWKGVLNAFVGLCQTRPKERQSMRFAFEVSMRERARCMAGGGDFYVTPYFLRTAPVENNSLILVRKRKRGPEEEEEQPAAAAAATRQQLAHCSGALLSGMGIVSYQKHNLVCFLWGLELFFRPRTWMLLSANTDGAVLSLGDGNLRRLLRSPSLMARFKAFWTAYTTCPFVLSSDGVRRAKQRERAGAFNVCFCLASREKWTWVAYHINNWFILAGPRDAVVGLRHTGLSGGAASAKDPPLWKQLVAAHRARRQRHAAGGGHVSFRDRSGCEACPKPTVDTFALANTLVFSRPVP